MAWPIIFLIFAIIEYMYSTINICGSNWITGNMWFMYLCMALCAIPFNKLRDYK